MSRLSGARAKRLVQRKAEKQARVYGVRCAVCWDGGLDVQIAARTQPVARARLTQHYQEAHADLWAAGYRPVMAQSQPQRV